MRVGDSARRTRTVTMRDIELFTELTGDRNPLHYDEEAAAATRFGGVIVQGGVTSGLLNAVVAEDLPGPGTVFLHTDWRFLAPVKPGDQITAEVEVIGLREDKPVTTLRTTITDQDGRIVLDGKAVTWSEPLPTAASPNQTQRSTETDGGLPHHDPRGADGERSLGQRAVVQGTTG
jgi:acyl dehydratase